MAAPFSRGPGSPASTTAPDISASALAERYSPAPIESASASTVEMPTTIVSATEDFPEPATAASSANVVRMPSIPPNTTPRTCFATRERGGAPPLVPAAAIRPGASHSFFACRATSDRGGEGAPAPPRHRSSAGRAAAGEGGAAAARAISAAKVVARMTFGSAACLLAPNDRIQEGGPEQSRATHRASGPSGARDPANTMNSSRGWVVLGPTSLSRAAHARSARAGCSRLRHSLAVRPAPVPWDIGGSCGSPELGRRALALRTCPSRAQKQGREPPQKSVLYGARTHDIGLIRPTL